MKPYSEDLRARIVEAVRAGTSKSAAARLFRVSLSTVKRYMRLADREASLAPRKGGGRPPKTDQTTRRLLEEDVKERPAATISDRRLFLETMTDRSLSVSTVKRLLKKMGFSQKTDTGALERDEFQRAAWRVTVAGEVNPERLVFVDEAFAGRQHLPCASASLVGCR